MMRESAAAAVRWLFRHHLVYRLARTSSDPMQTNHELLTDARTFLRDQLMGMETAGDVADSWDEFFGVYDTIIRRFARACGVPGDQLDECSQDVWVAIVLHLERFEPNPERGRFRTWLYQVVRSKATDLLRKESKRGSRAGDSQILLATPADLPPVDRTIEEHWQRETVRTLLIDFRGRVSDENFALFEARAIAGDDYDAIGDRHGISPQTARVRYHRVLRQFRELCERFAIDDV